MDPKLAKFGNILIYINIFYCASEAFLGWLLNDIAIHTNPVFQNGLLFVIAGLLLNIMADIKKMSGVDS